MRDNQNNTEANLDALDAIARDMGLDGSVGDPHELAKLISAYGRRRSGMVTGGKFIEGWRPMFPDVTLHIDDGDDDLEDFYMAVREVFGIRSAMVQRMAVELDTMSIPSLAEHLVCLGSDSADTPSVFLIEHLLERNEDVDTTEYALPPCHQLLAVDENWLLSAADLGEGRFHVHLSPR